uniref:DUF4371 domain-containing protein n=1 Tax=Paramormyrops kingsleyae TaxID=1676925 RepID=A0A3B3QYV9_9TELE
MVKYKTILQMFKRKDRDDENANAKVRKTCMVNDSVHEVQCTVAQIENTEVANAGGPLEASTGDDRPTTYAYPSIWSKEQFEQFKSKNEWLYAKNGTLGCTSCRDVKNLGVKASRGVNIANQLAEGKIAPFGHSRNVQLTSLRKKICGQRDTLAHSEAIKILQTAKKDILLNLNATSFILQYVAKDNKPFTDFENLIDLQQANSLDLGRILHSKTVCVDIIDHISVQMKNELMKRIIENRSKKTVLADESTSVRHKSTLIVFLKAKLDSLCAAHIKQQLMSCLFNNGFTVELLQEVLTGFCSDEASVMLGVKSGVGKLLQDDFPDIILWHCLNHRLELAVDQALDATGGTKDVQAFLDTLYSLYSQSPKNMRELSECAHNLHITLRRIGRVFTVRWVASSRRAVDAIWHSYAALAQHFRGASEDRLLFKLCSINFLKSLALMADNRRITLTKAHNIMMMYIKRIESLTRHPGQHTVEACQAEKEMKYKGEQVAALRGQLTLQRARLCAMALHVNEKETHLGFVEYKASGGRSIPNNMKKLCIAVDTLSASNADCEQGFSAMNNIITEYRSKLTTKNAANLLFMSTTSFTHEMASKYSIPFIKWSTDSTCWPHHFHGHFNQIAIWYASSNPHKI